MKKITLIMFMLILGSLASYGQNYQNAISGQFKMHTLATGENVYVFVGQNNTGSSLHVLGIAENKMLNQQNKMLIILQPEHIFFFGPCEGWQWMPGETFSVTYPDGRQQSWLFNPQANTSTSGFSPITQSEGPFMPIPRKPIQSRADSGAQKEVLQKRITSLHQQLAEARTNLQYAIEHNTGSVSASMRVNEIMQDIRECERQLAEYR